MSAAVSKVLASILGALLSSLAPQVLAAVMSRVKISLPSVKGTLHADELEKSILKNLGYSSLPALAVGVLTFCMVHDGEYIKNTGFAYCATLALGLIIDTIKKAYAGVDPSLASPADPATKPASSAPALAEVANVPIEAKAVAVEAPCPPGECKFAGRIVEPPQV